MSKKLYQFALCHLNPQNSLVDDVLALMLESDQKWDTMVADYVLTTRDAENGDQLYQEDQKFWLSKKGEWARVEISTDGMPLIVFVRNASTLNRENKKYKVYSTENTPDVFLYNDFNPRQLLLDTALPLYIFTPTEKPCLQATMIFSTPPQLPNQ